MIQPTEHIIIHLSGQPNDRISGCRIVRPIARSPDWLSGYTVSRPNDETAIRPNIQSTDETIIWPGDKTTYQKEETGRLLLGLKETDMFEALVSGCPDGNDRVKNLIDTYLSAFQRRMTAEAAETEVIVHESGVLFMKCNHVCLGLRIYQYGKF